MQTSFAGRFLAALLFLAAGVRAETHELKLAPANVHWGYYDARVKPVLRIASGDTVRVETMIAGGLERLRLAGAPESEIPESLKQVENSVTDRGPGAHPHVGVVRGASAVVAVNRAILARHVPWCRWKRPMRWSSSNPSNVVGARRLYGETMPRRFVIKSSRFRPSSR